MHQPNAPEAITKASAAMWLDSEDQKLHCAELLAWSLKHWCTHMLHTLL